MSDLRERVHDLGLHGLLQHFDEVAAADWLPWMVELEEVERQRRSLERRVRNAKLGRFKMMADFDWSWPEQLDRSLVNELFELGFVGDHGDELSGLTRREALKHLVPLTYKKP